MSLASTIENKKFLFGLLGLKAFLLGLLIVFSPIHLAPDEAQYWTWSQFLDWGYYSKPPAIAWQIWLTSSLFGSSEFGVRFGALVLGFVLPVILYLSSLRILGEKIAFWAAIMLAFSPLGIFLSFAATTDPGSILFFTLSLCLFARGVEEEKNLCYPLIGLCICAGALFKWTAYSAWLFIFLFLPFFPHLRKKTLFWGVALSLLALVPSIYWNWSHDWATFKHVGSTAAGKAGGNPGDFLAAQIGLLSPLLFFFLVAGVVKIFRQRPNRFLLVCAAVPSAILLYLLLSFFQKMQPNWALFLYPVGFIAAAYWGSKKEGWLLAGTLFSILLMGLILFIPLVQSRDLLPLPYRINPFRQNMGWDRIGKILQEASYNPETDFLFADKYQAASILSFYGPKQKRAYFFNLNQQRRNQFSYWPGIEQEKGKTGYFVILENTEEKSLPWYEENGKKRLSPYFEKVECLGSYPLFEAKGKAVKYAIVFRGEVFQGNRPPETDQF